MQTYNQKQFPKSYMILVSLEPAWHKSRRFFYGPAVGRHGMSIEEILKECPFSHLVLCPFSVEIGKAVEGEKFNGSEKNRNEC